MEIDQYKSGRTNIIARLENGDGPVFAFNTHMDVVPAGEGWSGDPLSFTSARESWLVAGRVTQRDH